MKFDRIMPFLCSLPLMLLASCGGGDGQIRVEDVEAVAGKTFAEPSELKFTIIGGENSVTLNSVYSDNAIETRMIRGDGRIVPPGDGIEISPGETVQFGGDKGPKVQLLGVNRVPRALEKIELDFVFSNGKQLYAKAPFTTPDGAQGL